MELERKNLTEKQKEILKGKVVVFIKFTKEKKWADDIVDGNLYMNKLKYFIDVESANNDGMADKAEGSINLHIAKMNLTNLSTGEKINIDFDTEQKMNFLYKGDDSKPIFCLSGLTVDDLNILSNDDDKIKFGFSWSKDDILKMKNEFGKYAVIINPPSFLGLLDNAVNTLEVASRFKNITYCEETLNDRVDSYVNQKEERFFYKDEIFKQQKEYRLVIDKEVDESLTINIGSMKGAAHIVETENLLNWVFDIKF